MIVYLYESQLNYFRRKARSTTNEIYACLVGKHCGGNSTTVYSIEYPKLELTTPMIVKADCDALQQIELDAEHQGLAIVGNIHSHPNFTTELSAHDHKHLFSGKEKIVGVVGVVGRRTFVTFWRPDSSLPCKIEYLKD